MTTFHLRRCERCERCERCLEVFLWEKLFFGFNADKKRHRLEDTAKVALDGLDGELPQLPSLAFLLEKQWITHKLGPGELFFS